MVSYVGDTTNTSQYQFNFKLDNQNTRILSRNLAEGSADSPDIILETLHPDNMEENFVWCFISPGNFFNASYSYDDEYSPNKFNQLHYHDYFELVYLISGTMYQQIESERHLYTAGSLCLLNCNVRHQEEFSTEYRALFLRLPIGLIKELYENMGNMYFQVENKHRNQVLENFLSDSLGLSEDKTSKKKYIDFIPSDSDVSVRENMYKLFDKLTKQLVNPEVGSTYIIKAIIVQIFNELSIKNHYKMVPLTIGTSAEAQLFESVRNQILAKHGRITREDLNESLSYNATYLNRIVKKYTGYSIKQYALQIAMKEAAEMLEHTDMQISEICKKLSFKNETYFYNSFQKIYGMTPKKYRQDMQNSRRRS